MSYRSYINDDERYTKKHKTKHKNKFSLTKLPPIDKNLLIVVLMLIVFGTIAVFSATAPEGVDKFQNPLYYPLKHIEFGLVGGFLMFLTSRIHYKNWKNWVMPVAWIIFGLIAATLVPGLGDVRGGSSRWLSFLPIQPSEFGKFACILLAATALSKVKNIWSPTVFKHFGIIAITLIIIAKQPNMSMFILLSATITGMLFVAGMNWRVLLFFLPVGVAGIAYMIFHSAYQSTRITGWLHPELDPLASGYNIIQSWYAIASGGLLGVGLGASKQKLYYLPVGYTDFIFSVISEELGFVGAVSLIILFLLFITFGFKVAQRSDSFFGKLLAFGIVLNIGLQALINMCVASGVFPVTGVTLPLISYGGSSFMATCVMIGVLFNISRYTVKKERKSDNGTNKIPS